MTTGRPFSDSSVIVSPVSDSRENGGAGWPVSSMLAPSAGVAEGCRYCSAMGPLAPLRDRDFRLYFAGEALSFFGSGLSLVALNWYLLERTHSTTAVGAYYAIALGAGLAAFPLSG